MTEPMMPNYSATPCDRLDGKVNFFTGVGVRGRSRAGYLPC